MSQINLEELASIYGYMPSLHDAHILSIRRVDGDLFIRLYVYDQPQGVANSTSAEDKHVVVELVWKEVRRADLYVTDNWLAHATFTEIEGSVLTELFDMESGKRGVIEAVSVSVHELQYPETPFVVAGLDSIDTVHISFSSQI